MTSKDTRDKILQAAFQEIHCKGFQASSLSDIIAAAGVTKGGLYHHFENKMALGYAVADELLHEMCESVWAKVKAVSGEGLDGLIYFFENINCLVPLDEHQGCPIFNLSQEMSPINEGFRIRIERLMAISQNNFENYLRTGQENGSVRSDVNCARSALFIQAAWSGIIGVAKLHADESVIHQSIEELVCYLNSLRKTT